MKTSAWEKGADAFLYRYFWGERGEIRDMENQKERYAKLSLVSMWVKRGERLRWREVEDQGAECGTVRIQRHRHVGFNCLTFYMYHPCQY